MGSKAEHKQQGSSCVAVCVMTHTLVAAGSALRSGPVTGGYPAYTMKHCLPFLLMASGAPEFGPALPAFHARVWCA